ncbi:MAG: DsbC family protein [Zetaproteobacteria bacterium]|nr:MAG: DsbC family protein [Zetaproteobacteria bacterium]
MARALSLLAFVMLAFSTGCQADSHQNSSSVEQTIRANVSRLSPNFKVDAIKPLDVIPGLYEIQSGDNIFYTNVTGDYLISGHIFSTKDRKDLTAVRLEDINRVDWNKLPLKDAIVSGDPKGTPVAIFTDPECPYCRKLETELPKVNGLKVYTFLFPLAQLHPKAYAKAAAIWCAKNQHKTMLDVMLKNVPLDKLPKASCDTPIDRNIKLGQSLGITGTPTLIAHDGRKHAGVMSAEKLMEWAK